MTFRPALPVTCLAAILAIVPARALEWQTEHHSIQTAPLQKTAELAFTFTNPGSRPVTITGIDSSCDCVVATASAKIIAPGASGRITAHFTVGERFGIYRRTLIVSTDEDIPAVALTLEIDVPEVATLTPRSLEWKVNAPAVEQAVEIAVTPGITLTIADVQATSDAFTSRLETVAAGRHYRLWVTPRSTAATNNAAFRLHATAGTGEALVLSAYGNVR